MPIEDFLDVRKPFRIGRESPLDEINKFEMPLNYVTVNDGKEAAALENTARFLEEQFPGGYGARLRQENGKYVIENDFGVPLVTLQLEQDRVVAYTEDIPRVYDVNKVVLNSLSTLGVITLKETYFLRGEQ